MTLKNNIEIFAHISESSIQTVPYKKFYFPSGEMGISLVDGWNSCLAVCIKARVSTPDDIIELLLVSDIVKAHHRKTLILDLPYIPFGRQDRYTDNKKAAFSLQVFAGMINSIGFDVVQTMTPHSAVSQNLINNLRVYEPWNDSIFRADIENIIKPYGDDLIVISPDAGARERSEHFANAFGIDLDRVFLCDKKRDQSTGNIIGYMSLTPIPENKAIVVFDDIIDGGRTFIELEKILPKNRQQLILIATHGIFSKGRQILLDAGYDQLFVCYNFIEERLKVIQT